MGVEYGPGQAAGLEQAEAEQHRIAHTGPDGGADVAGHGDILYQHRVDRYADHNEKCLKSQGKEGAQIVLPHLAPFPVDHGCHGKLVNGVDVCKFGKQWVVSANAMTREYGAATR